MKGKLSVMLFVIMVSTLFTSSFSIELARFETETLVGETETGLVGYWSFDEGSGTTAYDSSGNGNHGTLVNNPQWVRGRVVNALNFNQSRDDEVQFSDSSSLRSPASTNQITIMAWVMLAADLSDYTATMIKKGGDYSLEWGNAGTNRPAFILGWGDDRWIALHGSAWPKYEWHHIAATYDGYEMKIYTDGLLDASTSFGKNIRASTDYLGIGNWDVQWFTGSIDEVKIHNRALTIDEIQAEVGNSWPMFHHDLKHTGYSISKAPNTNNSIWSYTTGGAVYSSPAVANGKVYIGSDDYNVYALDAATGELIWSYTTGGAVRSSPAVAYGRVYVGSMDSSVYALNATTGALIWRFQGLLGSGGIPAGEISPAVAYGMVYVTGSYDNRVYALNSTTGALIWSYTTGGWVYSSPAVADGKVYVGSHDYNVYALDAATGAVIWSYTAGGAVHGSPAVAYDMVYVGTTYGMIYALDAATGAVIWSYTAGASVSSSPAVAYDMVYFRYQAGLHAFNATTGALIWNSRPIWGLTGATSPAVADGKVYVGSYAYDLSEFVAFNATTGTFIWSYKTGPIGYSPPDTSSAIAYGNVYIGSENGKIYAFGPKHNLTVVAAAGGTTNPSPGTYTYPTETFVSVSAIPNVNHKLDNWELDGINVGAANPFSFTMEADHTLRAVFAELPIPPDVAVTNVAPSKTVVGQGYDVSINVTAENQGDSLTTFYVTVYPSISPFPTPEQWQTFWSMGDVDRNGYINKHDLGLINSAKGSTPGDGHWNPDADLNFDGRVNFFDYFICYTNQGRDIWSFYQLPDPIGPQRVDLQAGTSINLTFVWNTQNIAKGNYTISATADPVPGETDTADNTLANGVITVTIPGDVNGDRIVDIFDIGAISAHWYPGPPIGPLGYHANADVNNDGAVDIFDIGITSAHWGQSW